MHGYELSGRTTSHVSLTSDELKSRPEITSFASVSCTDNMDGACQGQDSSSSPTRDTFASQGGFDMLPPSPSTHASWQILHNYAQSHASEHGYALSINTTAKNRSRIKLACVCFGQPKNTHRLTPETRVRKNRISYKTGCKMWVEGRRQEDGTWVLRVGEPAHNHIGRPSDGWSAQRKRTWGLVGSRVGCGGITAREELTRTSSTESDEKANTNESETNEHGREPIEEANSEPSLERGGLVWKIVEQEMLRRGERYQGRDRGVGHTIEVLQSQLPGINILKRDIYNIRAQIKKSRKAAEQDFDDDIEEAELSCDGMKAAHNEENRLSTNDESGANPATFKPLTAVDDTSSEFVRSKSQINEIPIPHITCERSLDMGFDVLEVQQLRKEITELKDTLVSKTQEIKEKTIEIAALRAQIDYVLMASGGRSSLHR